MRFSWVRFLTLFRESNVHAKNINEQQEEEGSDALADFILDKFDSRARVTYEV